MGQSSTKQPLQYSYIKSNGETKTLSIDHYWIEWTTKIKNILDKGKYYLIVVEKEDPRWTYHKVDVEFRLYKNTVDCPKMLAQLESEKYPKFYAGYPKFCIGTYPYHQILGIITQK